MTVDRSQLEDTANLYHLVRLALWSGDVDYCIDQLNRMPLADVSSEPRSKRRRGYPLHHSRKEMILYAAKLLKQAVGEVDKDAEERIANAESGDSRLITSKDFRGIIREIDVVAFELRAYPSNEDPDARQRSMRNVARVASASLNDTQDSGSAELSRPDASANGEWVRRTDSFMRVAFTALGQVCAVAYWCQEQDAETIRKEFEALLGEIDSE